MRLHAVVLLIAGCAGSFPKQPKPDATSGAAATLEGQTLGVPGESMEYQVDLRGITVGRVLVGVGQPGWVDGRHAIIVRSRGTSAGIIAMLGELRWELTTTLDMASGEIIHELEESWIHHPGGDEHERHDHTGSKGNYNVHAAAGLLRAWRSHVGDRGKLALTIDSFEIEIEARDEARELLAGRPAVRYSGIALEKYPFTLWISDDESRVPLLLRAESKWGTIAVELVHYDLTANGL